MPDSLSQELWQTSKGSHVGLGQAQFVEALVALGDKYSYSCAPGTVVTSSQREQFWRALHLEDVALAYACSLGINVAWEIFVECYRDFLERTAIGITGSS